MVFAMLTWGVAWTSAKIINAYLDYNNLVFLRFLVGVVSMFPFIINKKLSIRDSSISTKLNMLVVGILFYLYNQCFFIATDRGYAGMGAVFVTTTNPIITFVIVSIIKRKVNYNDLFAIFIGIVGGCIILDIFSLGLDALLISGNIYFIFCSLIWGFMTVLMSRGQVDLDSIVYIIYTYSIASIIAFYFIDIPSLLNAQIFNFNFLIHFIIVCSAMSIGTSIYIIASARMGPVKSSTFIFSVPFIAMLTAHIILDEYLGVNIFIGGLMSILAIILINKKNNNLF